MVEDGKDALMAVRMWFLVNWDGRHADFGRLRCQISFSRVFDNIMLILADCVVIFCFPEFLTISVQRFLENLVQNPYFQVTDKKCHRKKGRLVNFLKMKKLTRLFPAFLAFYCLFFIYTLVL